MVDHNTCHRQCQQWIMSQDQNLFSSCTQQASKNDEKNTDDSTNKNVLSYGSEYNKLMEERKMLNLLKKRLTNVLSEVGSLKFKKKKKQTT